MAAAEPRRTRKPASSPSRLTVALRRAEAIKMRIAGTPIVEIKDALGYRSTAAVYQDISRAHAATVGEPAAELRALEVARMDATLIRLNEMEAKVRTVRDAEHITVNNGRVIYVPGPDGENIPLLDDDPVLRATVQLLAIEDRRANVQQRRAKLLGLDAPTKVSVITDEALDEEHERLLREVAELERLAAEEDGSSPDAEGQEGGAPQAE